MIRKLQIQITAILMAILSSVTIGILVAVNIVNYNASQQEAFHYLNEVASSGEMLIASEENSSLFSYRFFRVFIDMYGNAFKSVSENNAMYTDEQLAALATKVLIRGKNSGAIDHMLYTVKDESYGKLIVFMDNRITEANIRAVGLYSLIFGSMGLFLLFCMVLFLAKWLTKPIEEAFHKQKIFVSDVSHELKTPLAVITANADTLESEIGESKWLGYIKNEAYKMSGLVNNMLTLTRMETTENKLSFQRFDLTETVRGAVMPFESIAYEKQVDLSVSLQESIFLSGNQEQLGRVAAILTDNAVKYTEPGGKISVLLQQNRGKTILQVSNTGPEIPYADRKKIFDRFYRVDKARSRENGSYGLGLSIAKTIVSAHHGTISVDCRNSRNIFTVTIS